MGICSSTDSISVSTIKLVLHDGTLQEFSYPVNVSQALQKNPGCFICNADEMDFNNFVTAIHGDEDLQPGQLYFVLPLSRLKYPLQAEEIAALAVKASSALSKNGRVVPLAFSVNDGKTSVKRRSKCNGGGCGGGRGRRGMSSDFTSSLSAIQE
ncbi:hypothetical protein ACHQM5_016966 [Ranunculus cassubicifolius]